MIARVYKYLTIFILLILLFLFFLITFNSDLRRSLFTKAIGGYNLYQLSSLQNDLKGRYDILNAKKKLVNYIEFSKKYANGKSKLLIGIYDATRLVESKASSKEDYLILEDVFSKIIEIDPTMYEAHVWIAKSKYFKDNIKKSYEHIDKAIKISSVQHEPYRLAMRIASENKDKKLFSYYCKMYENSKLGGNTPRYKSSFFGGNVLNKIAVEFIDKEKNNEIYTYSGLILNEFVEYSFLPEEPLNLDNINIFLSYLSGIKIEVGEVIIFTEKNQINKKPNNLLFSSNSSFIDYEKDENISLLIMKEGDEIININFGEKFENVNKIILKMKISKLDLVNQKNCQLNG